MKVGRFVTFAVLAVAITSGALLAQAPQAVGTWAPLQDLASPLSNGASVALPDGRTLIAGGTLTDGTPTDQVTIYDPVSDSLTAAGVLVSPRSGHTATLLEDGRVLMVGGVTEGGLISTDIEMFDPTAGTSVLVAQLAEPRRGHVAASLPDGTVLVAGGATVDNVVLQSAALFDTETNSVSPLSTSLQFARENASATTLLDGRVLVVGGSNGAADLASAEIYDRYSRSFALAATQMSVARQGHSAVLLPHNGSVLIVGGTSNSVAQAGTDLFLPAVFPDPFTYGEGEFAATGAMAAARTAAVAGPTGIEGFAFAAGAGAKDAEVYRFATIKTDKDDYAPGAVALITGSGWQPGEDVTLLFQEDPAVHEDYVLTVNADTAGNIYWNQWAPQLHDLNVRFYLTASGSQSRAQTTFTDGGTLTIQFAGSGSGQVHGEGAGQGAFDCSNNCTPATYTSNGSVTLTATPASDSTFVSWSSNVVCDPNPNKGCTVKMDQNQTVTATFNKKAAKQDQTITFAALGSKTYGNADFAVNATASSTLPVTFTAAGQCTVTSGTVHILGAGSCTVTAQQAGNASYNAAPDVSRLFTIAKQPASVTANNRNKTYGQANPTFDAAVVGAVNGDTLAYSLTTAATQTSGVGSYPIVVTLGSNPNYDVTPHDGALTIGKATASVTATDTIKTYGQANPTFDAAVVGAVNGDTLAYTLTTAATQTSGVGSYPIVVTLGSNPNYDVTPHDGALTIGKAPASITATDTNKTYGQANPVFDAAVVGAVNGDILAYSLTTTATQTSGVGSYPIVVTLGNNPNYDVTPHDGALTIGKAPGSVTATDTSKTYGQANPTFDAAVVGAVNGDTLAYSLTTAATQTSGVGSYPIVVTLGSNPNYDVTPHDGALTIGKAPASITATDTNKTYGQANPAFDAAVVGAVNGDILAYSLTTTATQTSGVGSYPIVVTLGNNPNYDVTPHDGALTIGKAPGSVTATDTSKTYGQANPAFDAAVVGAVNGDILAYSLTTTATQTSGVGSYPIVVTLGNNPNYDVTPHDGALTIGKAPASVTVTDTSKTYGQANPDLDAVVSGAVNGDTLAYSLTTTATQTSGVGSYPIVVTLGSNPNYDVTPHDGALTIGKAPASVTATDTNKTYGQANPDLDAVVSGAVNGDTLAYTLTTAATQTSDVGSYPIVVTLGSNPNYDVTPHDGALTIGKATASVTATDTNKTYGQANPTFDAAVVGAVNGDTLAYTLTTAATQTSGVGSYPIVVTLGSNPNYDVTPHDGALTIGKATASVTATDTNKTYGQANPTFDAAVVGAVNGDTLAYTLTTAATQASGVGSYPIVVTLGSNPNYDVTPLDGALTISKATASVTATDTSKTYGQANPTFDAAVVGAVNGDTLAYTLTTTATQTSGVGSYPIVVTLGSNPNYDVTPHDGALTIGKAPASVKANDKTRTYGDANPALDAVVTGPVNGEVLAYSLATSAVETSGIGGYSIVVTLGANPNYEVSKTAGTLTVTKASLTVTANDTSRPYGVANPTFSGSYSGQKNGETFTMSFSTSATTGSPVGDYAIVPSASGGTTSNYNVTSIDGTLTVGAWSLKGFYQPVGEASSIVSAPRVQPAVSGATVWNAIKGGQTVPMKFNIYRAVGGAQVTTVADAFTGAGFSAYQLPTCSGGYTDDEIPLTDLSTGGTELRYDGTQFIQNWKTPKVAGADLCFRAVVTAKDGSTITAFFKVKK